jgi:quercetin dioxygenase-like cupin family protein
MTLAPRTPQTALPGEPRPYVLRAGDGRAHLLIDQVGRVLVGAEESRGALSYTLLDGPRGGPIPFHFHEAEHDFFFCHRGQVQVWAGEQSRIMNAGDFASVPPKVPHAYQLHGHYSGFTGPITPGGWDRFFDFCGIPYAGPGYPVDFQPVLPLDKFFAAQEKFAMTYVPDQPWAPASTAPDDALPGACEPYFLRAGEGERHVAGGQLQTVVCGAVQTGGAATMVTLELFKGSGLPSHVHERTHEVMLVLDGQLHVTIDGEEHLLAGGDAVSIPSGTEHAYASAAHYTKVLASSAPGGLERLLIAAGTPTDHHMPSPDLPDPEPGALSEAAGDTDVRFL